MQFSKFKKINRFIFCFSALSVAISSPLAHADGEVGVLMKTLSNPFWGAMGQGVEDAAKSSGTPYFIQAVESDQAAESQLNVCNTMLQRKPSALITAAINSTNLLPCLSKAQERGIPVVDLDGNLDPDILKRAKIDIAFQIGSDNIAAGQQAAQYLAEQLGSDAKGAVLVIEGLSGNITGQKRVNGFTDKLKSIAPGLKVVASLPGDWDRGKAASITNDILIRHPDLVGIFAANDGMALGAVESVYAAGKGGQVTVIGVDGNSDAVKSIQSGRLNASIAQLPYLVGKQAVERVKKIMNGESTESVIHVPTLVLTKEVMESGKEPLLEFVK
ncbi:putative ABC-type sugar transport system,periplasmic component [Vibrio nigripulchritudo SO65]|uniref:sugar ABC transporter substrate-binding protein n=1 Tax=Vibrio nigripulchritudo TaxID=28173 RepID=UPI0003B180CE|nr:substrate-binding domain-containing protein [Vibrio nigripulchritudo]CCN36086.1 putative ABC-type sugar transport system,periplasmic component [Vibrio nigripulchritudo AM115]CCN44366.1 putative ABC-type sugar transport system,periplasmic component [Vibrio nigripulchritudo FTn2]CCN68103.1 putative ABC-type sugar transport system,periplasmic component [Vibrio nigripulchritudo POn4]CCN75385.1 putative ABC-type sugar transport system,periplasmic component [Vibrio nigripulchritudo SO65]